MSNDRRSTQNLALLLGGAVVLAALLFVATGGMIGGKKSINSDADLPPVSSPEKSR
jgi:hypothetical protein